MCVSTGLNVGLSSVALLIAGHRVVSYEEHWESLCSRSISDPELDGLEMLNVMPLRNVRLQCVCEFKLLLEPSGKSYLCFELCNTRLTTKSRNLVWSRWKSLVSSIKDGVVLPSVGSAEDEPVPIHSLCDVDEAGRAIGDRCQGLQQLQQLVRSYNTSCGKRSSLHLPANQLWSANPAGCTTARSTDSKTGSSEDGEIFKDDLSHVIMTDQNRNNAANGDHHKSSRVRENQPIGYTSHMTMAEQSMSRNSVSKTPRSLSHVGGELEGSRSSSGRLFTRSSGIGIMADGQEDTALNVEVSPAFSKVDGIHTCLETDSQSQTIRRKSQKKLKRTKKDDDSSLQNHIGLLVLLFRWRS